MSYTAATATFQLTFPEIRWSSISVRTGGSHALFREKSFTCLNTIYQTEFDSLYVMRKTQYQLSWVADVLVGNFPSGQLS